MRRLPTVQELDAIEAALRTPGKTVQFDDQTSLAIRRRHDGNSKPWQLQHYVKSPHTRDLFSRGRSKYRELIITKDAWPTQEARAKFGKTAWDQVIKENPELYANCQYCFLVVSHANCLTGSHKTFNNWFLRLV
jgi:hypothetical protein